MLNHQRKVFTYFLYKFTYIFINIFFNDYIDDDIMIIGAGGNAIKLQANFFKILSAPDWCLLQYRVDFAPEEDRTVVRKGLLRLHKERLGIYMFDGSVMYTCNRYHGVSRTVVSF